MTNLSKGKSARWNGKSVKQVKEKKIKKTKVVIQEKKPRGKRVCPTCKHLVGIRKYECQHCGFNFPQKPKVVNKDSVFKKSSEKSILTILEHNIFNTLFKNHQKPQLIDFKPITHPLNQIPSSSSSPEISIKINNTLHKLKYYKSALINKKYRVFSAKQIIKCIKMNEYALVFSQERSVQARGMTKNDQSTVNMYGLQFFHKLGHRYEGVSNLYISLSHLQKGYYRTEIKRNIVQIQLRGNIAAILCGNGCVEFYVLPSKQQSGEQTIQLGEPSRININNGISICWQNGNKSGIILGDTEGNIKIYSLNQKLEPSLSRVFFHAHYNYITALRCCPLNDNYSHMFCSSGYDGSLKIWDYDELEPIYEIDITSKKINNIVWDNGGKFILVERDDNCDGCSLLTFYSTVKTVKRQILMPECQQRYIKDYNNYEYLATSETSQYCAFASSNGRVQICDMEYLRKASIKKKSHSITSYPFIGFNLQVDNKNNNKVITLQQEKVEPEQNTFEPYQHIISDVTIVNRNGKEKIAVSTYQGLVIIMQKPSEKK